MASVDPNMPVISIRSLRDQVAAQFGQELLIARLTSLFAILSLVLASIGLYGVTSYNAGRRMNEVGIRMALGAVRRDIVLLLMRGAFGLAGLGLLIGTPLAFISGKYLGVELHGISPFNPLVTFAAAAVLGLSALTGALIPAIRASLISPLAAVRAE
jgi:ABC-type antimicrobial peptide transport system permease subunit